MSLNRARFAVQKWKETKKMGQVLEFCTRCENKRGCDLCPDLHEWIIAHIDAEKVIKCKAMTNADRIRAMSDDELAAFLDKCEARGNEDSSIAINAYGEQMDMLKWLRQPAEEDDQ